ncbi:hypothetical protein DTO013E5_6287 [Penicillium roqueforti]|nr:hypothetical protein CBS147337_8116 [Penicillium roqueforti]KAI2674099.1 hypothetical protein CBS147355_7274 [Penicillium roqueforti]KAI2714107.1 hypothetical protein CBS147318_6848 [Penicillium roqueforti]KAI2739311.1 hypothetical protein DTO012A1_6139 [Penicillium roqueforti]KAI2753584.1 hypothetical protein DTO013F2_2546 [Penicillium roqueforti]
MLYSHSDWNSDDEFFKFTRSRFLVDEAENLRRREIKFNLNRLASVAADSIGAAQCISIIKYPDGMFNKTFLMTMEDGREVVAKVPNPNSGIPHFTMASEFATTDFVGLFETRSTPNLANATGLGGSQKSSTHQHVMSSLYYARDVQFPAGNHYVKDGMAVKDSEFAIGPATGRDWFDAGRSILDIERRPWASPTQYLQAVGTREIKAIQFLKPPKQTALFCGPKLHQPDAEKKLTALAWYQKIVDAIIPKDTSITNPYLWHDDLHDDNIFVDPDNPERITGIIDWQSCRISPLISHNLDPAFLDWDGLEPETLDLAPRPTLARLSPDERSAAMHEYTVQNVFIGWRNLMRAKNPDLYRVVEFRKTAAFGLIFLAHRMFEYGEPHFLSLLVDLKDMWADLPGVISDIPFPFEFSETDLERIKLDCDKSTE